MNCHLRTQSRAEIEANSTGITFDSVWSAKKPGSVGEIERLPRVAGEDIELIDSFAQILSTLRAMTRCFEKCLQF